MDTILLNETAVCSRCKCEYLPEYSFHKKNGICDECIEHEIDRVYGERGDPWSDDDIYLQDCAICHTQYNITDKGASIHYCSECQKAFNTERREWERKYGDI